MNFTPETIRKTILLLVSVMMIFLYGSIDTASPEFARADLNQYRMIANAAPGFSHLVSEPYAYRFLGPYVIGRLPLSNDFAFNLVTPIILIITVFALYGFLRRQHVADATAVFVVILWVMNRHAFGFTAWNTFQIDDILGVLSLIVGYQALVNRRWTVFAAALVIGVMARETAVLLIPTAVAYGVENRFKKREWQSMIVGSVACIAMYISIHILVPVGWKMSLWESLQDGRAKVLRPETWLRLLINTFLPMTFIPLIMWRETKFFFTKRLHLIVLVAAVLGSTFFGTDNERLLQPALVVAYWLLAVIIDRTARTFPSWWKVLLLVGAFLSTINHLTGRYPISSKFYSIVISAVALIAVSIGTLIAKHDYAPKPS